jgi:hypothetical protein
MNPRICLWETMEENIGGDNWILMVSYNFEQTTEKSVLWLYNPSLYHFYIY